MFLLIDEHRKRVEHTELLAGIIASTVANWSMHTPKEALRPRDYMPSRYGASRPKRPKVNRKLVAEQVRFALDNYQQHYEAHHKNENPPA